MFEWLLSGDPAVRWQTMRDLMGADEIAYEEERARIPETGWGRLLLESQDPDGLWNGSLYNGKWTSTTYTLYLLKLLGLAPRHPAALKGCRCLIDRGLFEGREIRFSRRAEISDLGVTAIVLSLCGYFEFREFPFHELLVHVLGRQRQDGSWRPSDAPWAAGYSFETTLLVLECLMHWESADDAGRADRMHAAVESGRRFLLGHDLYIVNGRSGKPGWTTFSFPPYWFYDVLSALDYLQASAARPEGCLRNAVKLVEARRSGDGTWKLGAKHRGRTFFDMESVGRPSRWNTLRALRVLDWWGGRH